VPPRGPLHGLRVVELAAIGPVPFCGMLLADMGAEIVLVQPPAAREARMPLPEREDPLWRGRTRTTLDLKSAEGRAALLDLAAHADVLLEGFRSGVMERLGLDPQACLAANPALVVGRMTGWGQDGPLARSAGHDPNYLAITGALHAIGFADRPPVQPLNLVGDFGGGSLYLAMGVLAAVLHARATGRGQVVDAAMVDGAASLMTMVYGLRGHGMWSDRRGANLMDGGAPFSRTYETADGKAVAVCALEPAFYANLLRGLGLDTEVLPAQLDQASWPELGARFAAIFRTRTRDAWAALFEGTDACVTPVLDLSEAPHHPQNVARGVFVGDERPLPRAAPRFSATPTRHAPVDGADLADLLSRWGAAGAALTNK
jgi:alpha-methylacyl-CoA racemase